jgi:hypothetical protein
MILKYFLYLTDATLAIKFDTSVLRLSVGGNMRFYEQIKLVVGEYFNFIADDRHIKKPQVNKIRIDLSISEKAFFEGKKKLSEAGLILQSTKTLERIMR